MGDNEIAETSERTNEGHKTRGEKASTAATTLHRMQHCKSCAAEQWRPLLWCACVCDCVRVSERDTGQRERASEMAKPQRESYSEHEKNHKTIA